jgi:hypothetical protein
MPRSSKEDEVRKRILAYLKTAEAGDPSDFPIDVRNISRRVRCSPTTIYKYGLENEISAARKRQANNNPKARRASKRQKDKDAMRAARSEIEEHSKINKGLVARLALVEYNAARLGFDPEELYKPMPKPMRSVSRAGTRKNRWRRRQ